MSDPNSYDVKELETVIDGVRETFRDKLAGDTAYFGRDAGVAARIDATLGADALKGTVGVPAGIDTATTAGLMAGVDLTILDHKATTEAVEAVARRAAKEHCATVCVYPEHVPIVSRIMQEEGVSDVPPIAVVGFPSVAEPSADVTVKTVQETRDAIAAGAKEIDMVVPTSFREDKDDRQAHFAYIKSVCDAAHENGIPVKVILETAYLNDRQIAEASILSKIAGADWVKTSTGFAEEDKLAEGKSITAHKGATPHDVALMRLAVGDASLDDAGNEKPMGVKASGGVRNREQAIAVYEAGADRIGASGGKIVPGYSGLSGGIDVRTEAEKILTAAQDAPKRAAGGLGGY